MTGRSRGQVGVRLVMSEVEPSCLVASVAQGGASGTRSGAQAGLRRGLRRTAHGVCLLQRMFLNLVGAGRSSIVAFRSAKVRPSARARAVNCQAEA
jgi:hypothetical protein